MTSLISDYLSSLSQARLSGAATQERSLYPALQALLATIGDTLVPKVFCVHELADTGAGRPDYGLFTQPQLSSDALGRNPIATVPERGVIEAKGPATDILLVADSPQVARYWEKYGLVLVTNFRSFMVMARNAEGRMVRRERFDLAANEESFWRICAAPARLPKDVEVRFQEFLTRVLLHNATLSQPRDVAFFLASYAKDCLWRLESTPRLRAENPLRRFDSLATLRESLETALAVQFDTARGLHFFHSTLVQTLFYGLFSAWVIWYRMPPDRGRNPVFSAHGAAWNLKLPVLRELFHHVYSPGALDGLGIADVLDWAADVLGRVDGRAFFGRFREEEAVQYFYEPFLESFDPELRRQLGVWYTPAPVVDYMVERVDQALRHELGIPLGLADERVHVLDPCCGTGSFITAVLDRIGRTLAEQGDDALLGAQVKRAAMTRVHGFEIMPAPFVVAHLQVSLLLAQKYDTPLDDAGGHTRNRDEWASIYLTNALTGHDPRFDRQIILPLPDLRSEMDVANRLKRECPILVVLGNPPYNGFAGVEAGAEERELSTVYRQTRNVRAPEGQGLNDLYVRFWRMAERRIAEQTGCGVVCLISNYSWLDGFSYTGMREQFLDRFDGIWIDCLNGDKFKTGKRTPDGRPDPSIFSTRSNREGIQVGTAIGLAVRRGDPESLLERGAGYLMYEEYPPLPVDPAPRDATVHFRHFWGADKLDQLAALAAGHAPEGVTDYQPLTPDPALGLPFVPASANATYFSWPSLPELMPVSYPGVKTSRDDFLVDIDRDRLVARMMEYFDPDISDEELGRRYPGIMDSTARYPARAIRGQLLQRGMLADKIVRYAYRPFDTRWVYWEPMGKLLDEKRESLFPYVFPANRFLLWSHKSRRELAPVNVASALPCLDLADRGANAFPLSEVSDQGLLGVPGHAVPNLAEVSRRHLALLGFSNNSEPDLVFRHIVAILSSQYYLAENTVSIKQDWPRIPLPSSPDRLQASADLGRRVADLLDPDRPVAGVTTAPLRPLIREVGLLTVAGGTDGARQGGAARLPADLRITAGWGHPGQNNTCMPGRGQLRERPWTEQERAAMALEARGIGLDEATAQTLLGATCFDIHLNQTTFWRGIPATVWRFTIGGYQVLKKWLSYREHTLLRRPLTDAEALHFRSVARRLTALVLLGPALDGNYRGCTAQVWSP